MRNKSTTSDEFFQVHTQTVREENFLINKQHLFKNFIHFHFKMHEFT